MAFAKNNTRSTNDLPELNINGATIQAVYQIADSCIVFTLNIPGASFRGMRLVEKRDGGHFIAAPQSKGKDGNYHDLFMVWLSETDEKRVIDAVLKHYTSKNETRDFKTRYEV